MYSFELALHSLELPLYSFELSLYSIELPLHSLELFLDSIEPSLHHIELPLYSFELSLYPIEPSSHPVELPLHSFELFLNSIEPSLYSFELPLHSIKLFLYSIEPSLYPVELPLYSFELFLDSVEPSLYPVELPLHSLELFLYSVEPSSYPVELALYSFELSLYPLELPLHSLELPLGVGFGLVETPVHVPQHPGRERTVGGDDAEHRRDQLRRGRHLLQPLRFGVHGPRTGIHGHGAFRSGCRHAPPHRRCRYRRGRDLRPRPREPYRSPGGMGTAPRHTSCQHAAIRLYARRSFVDPDRQWPVGSHPAVRSGIVPGATWMVHGRGTS